MILKLFRLALFLTTGTAWAAGNLLLVTDLPDEHLAYRPDLRLVATAAINQLDDYEVSKARTDVRPDSDAKINAMIDAARRADLTAMAVVTLADSGWRGSELTTRLYDVASGDLIIQRTIELDSRDVEALLAQLEYELPILLKREFRELGRVIQTGRDEIVFDLGGNAGVEVGQMYRVFRQGEEIRDTQGNRYGYVERQTGVVEVTAVSAVYARAEIKLGRLSIRHNDWVEHAGPDLQAEGRILSKLDNEVAINLGRDTGVTPGSYFAVHKTIKPIDADHAFREVIGRIRITSVDDHLAYGEIARSDHYNLTQALVKEGDTVEEVGYRHRNQLVLGRNSFGVLGDPNQIWFLGFQTDSGADIDLSYRLRAGWGDTWYGSIGLVNALNHSESFRYGLDGLYGPDGLGTHLFVEVDIPTPISERARFSLETGYLLGAIEDAEGLSISLSVKLGLDRLL